MVWRRRVWQRWRWCRRCTMGDAGGDGGGAEDTGDRRGRGEEHRAPGRRRSGGAPLRVRSHRRPRTAKSSRGPNALTVSALRGAGRVTVDGDGVHGGGAAGAGRRRATPRVAGDEASDGDRRLQRGRDRSGGGGLNRTVAATDDASVGAPHAVSPAEAATSARRCCCPRSTLVAPPSSWLRLPPATRRRRRRPPVAAMAIDGEPAAARPLVAPPPRRSPRCPLRLASVRVHGTAPFKDVAPPLHASRAAPRLAARHRPRRRCSPSCVPVS